MNRPKILVIDDKPDALQKLLCGLKTTYDVVGYGSGREAVDIVEKEPDRFDYAVIDQVLGENAPMDGVETTKRIADISENIFILLFSNVPAITQEQRAEQRFRAYDAGAHRYLERATEEDAPLQVEQFIREMVQLKRIRERVEAYYDERTNVPSLLTQLDLGVDIVDRYYKVWFMNDAMRRITGVVGPALPRQRCMDWHHYKLCPCPGCLVAPLFEPDVDGQRKMLAKRPTEYIIPAYKCRNRVFLSPFKNRPGRLFYLDVWVQPVVDEHGSVLLAEDEDHAPLAVMETVYELTDSERLRRMPVAERLAIIASAIHERLRPGFTHITPFEHVAIYAPTVPTIVESRIVMQAVSGYAQHNEAGFGAPFDHNLVPRWNDVLKNVRDTGWGFFSADDQRLDLLDGSLMPRCVYWPILDSAGRLVAFVRASGQACAESDVQTLRPYCEEIQRAVEDWRRSVPTTVTVATEYRLHEIDLHLQTVASPEAALRFLVTRACQLTDSYLGHIREKRDDQAVLIRLGPHEYDGYEGVARASWPLLQRASWSARTILSGAEQILQDLQLRKRQLEKERASLDAAARAVLAEAQSICFEPLILEGRCMGAIGFHSKRAKNYCDDTVWLLRQIARRAAWALHDFAAKREAEDRLYNVGADTVQLLLHNINQPLGVLRNELDMIRRALAGGPQKLLALKPSLEAAQMACNRLGAIREGFQRLFRPVESERARLDVKTLVENALRGLLPPESRVKVHTDLADDLVAIQADEFALRTCLEVLIQNALDEFARRQTTHDNALKLRLRRATRPEAAHAATRDDSLAIEIEDNGAGVSAEAAALLFRVIKSQKSSGLGIGLVLARRLAREAGGDLYLDPEFNAGARFILVLPYTQQKDKGADAE